MSGVPVAATLSWAANPKLLQSVEFLVTVGLLVLILLVGAVVLYFTDAWRKKQLTPDRESADALTTYRAMYERGEITESEYLAVRDKVADQLRQDLGAAPSAPTTRQTGLGRNSDQPPGPSANGDGPDAPENPPGPPTG